MAARAAVAPRWIAYGLLPLGRRCGPDYLVAPVLQKGAASRKVYLPQLPAGSAWKNVFTGVETETAGGGKTITEATPLDSFPLYKRQAKGAPLVLQ